MNINKKISIEKALFFCLLSFGVFPILPEKLKGLPVILFLVISALSFYLNFERKFNYVGFLKLSSLYIINVLTVFYTSSFYFPKNKLETTLSLLIIPLAFFLIDLKKLKSFNRRVFLKLFILSTGILSLYSLFIYFINGLFYDEELKVNSFRKLITEIPYLNDHPIYISIFLGISLLLIYSCYKNSSKFEKGLLILIALINIFHIVLLTSKGVIIAIVLSTIFYILLSFKNKIIKILFSISLILLFITSVLIFPNMERRFREFGIKTTYAELHINNSTSVRLAIYRCALKKIKEKPVLGYGWGNGSKALMDCYESKSNYLYENKFNSHNQFLGFYLDGGIIAFIVIVLFLFNQFKFSLANKDYIFTSILSFFLIIMFTENILDRQSGLIIFIFFISFFRFIKKQ